MADSDLLEKPTNFCGCEIKQREDKSIELNQQRYAEGLAEIHLTRERREQASEEISETERKQLRVSLGALSWRATQSAPWLSASISYLQGCFKEARVEDLIQTNKLIRLQRSFSQGVIKFSSEIRKPISLTYHDASYACRRDGSSQGGLLTMLVDEGITSGVPSHYSPVAWQSRKLPRVCRSSTAAEIQTGSHAMDAHEFTKQMLIEWYKAEPIAPKDMDRALQKIQSVVVTDSKNLYDYVVRAGTSGLQLEEKRLALEVLSIRERVRSSGVQFRWLDSDPQLADGVSKPFAFYELVAAFQKKHLSIEFDDQFTSAEKKRAQRATAFGSKTPKTPLDSKEQKHQEKVLEPC